jgi:hypothetical protein
VIAVVMVVVMVVMGILLTGAGVGTAGGSAGAGGAGGPSSGGPSSGGPSGGGPSGGPSSGGGGCRLTMLLLLSIIGEELTVTSVAISTIMSTNACLYRYILNFNDNKIIFR